MSAELETLLSLLKQYNIGDLGPVARQPAFPPSLVRSIEKDCIYTMRDYTVVFPSTSYGNAVNGTANLTMRFGNVPASVYALTAWSRDEANPLTITGDNVLNTFKVQITRDSDQKVQAGSAPVMAGMVLGTAERPRYVGGDGIPLQGNDSWEIDIQSLRIDTEISITAWVVEVRPVEAVLN